MNPRMENARNQFGISIARTMELEQAPETHRRAESAAEWAETSCWCRNYEESSISQVRTVRLAEVPWPK